MADRSSPISPTSLDSAVAWSASILYKKNPRKGYVQYWGVLRRKSASNPHCIELYEKSEPQFVIELENVLCIKPLEGKEKEKSRKYEFQIITVSSKHQFATKEAEGCRTWVKKLNRQLFGPPEAGIVYEYRVQILPTTHSQRLGLHGSYNMKVSDSHMTLVSADGTLPTQFNCNLTNVAQASHVKDGILVIKTDMNADIGEGGFAFHANNTAEIVSIIEHRRKSQGQRKTSKSFSSRASASHCETQPPPLPLSRAHNLQPSHSIAPFSTVRRVSVETDKIAETSLPPMSASSTTSPRARVFSSDQEIGYTPIQFTSVVTGTGESGSDPDEPHYVSCSPEPVYQTILEPKEQEIKYDYLRVPPLGPSKQQVSRLTLNTGSDEAHYVSCSPEPVYQTILEQEIKPDYLRVLPSGSSKQRLSRLTLNTGSSGAVNEKAFRGHPVQQASSPHNQNLRRQSASVYGDNHTDPSPYEVPRKLSAPEVKPYSVVVIPSEPDFKTNPYSIHPADLHECEIDSRPPAILPTPRPRPRPRNSRPAETLGANSESESTIAR